MVYIDLLPLHVQKRDFAKVFAKAFYTVYMWLIATALCDLPAKCYRYDYGYKFLQMSWLTKSFEPTEILLAYILIKGRDKLFIRQHNGCSHLCTSTLKLQAITFKQRAGSSLS